MALIGGASSFCARASVACALLAASCGAPDVPSGAPPPPSPRPSATYPPAPPPFATGEPFPTDTLGPVVARLDLGAPCDPTRTAPADGSNLLVQDAEVLSRFSLERLLGQIVASSLVTTTGSELFQRLFDVENSVATAAFSAGAHCTAATDCPRAEGALATSTGFFTAGDPDHFSPVAVVARFDLMPSDFATCGEYRVVYAKDSGKTDPNNRLFVIFEGVLPNPSGVLKGCRPVAELWAGLGALDPGARADALDTFFFVGSAGFGPVVAAQNYGLDQGNCSYGGSCGQVRVGLGMQEPWEFRQFRPAEVFSASSSTGLGFLSTPITGSPRPELFDASVSDPSGDAFRTEFLAHVSDLASTDLGRVRLPAKFDFDADQGAIGALGSGGYRARVRTGTPEGDVFLLRIASALESVDSSACPPGDPLSAERLLDRATAASCEGCHAPDSLLPPGRPAGCGKVWPASLGTTHVNENGDVSPALRDVFLPHRADVLTTYLEACDSSAVLANLQPVPPIPPRPECFVAGTLVTMADGSRRAIERVLPGELVLSVDEARRALVPERVDRVFVRPVTDRLITVNGSLVATPNHPFRTLRGWVDAASLTLGDHLLEAHDLGQDGAGFELSVVTVDALTDRPGSVVTYNLAVSRTHAYFAGGFLVHDGP